MQENEFILAEDLQQQETTRSIIKIIAVVTMLFASVFGMILYFMMADNAVLIPAATEATIAAGIFMLNRYGHQKKSIHLTFLLHCTSTLYFGLIFSDRVPIAMMALFLAGIACLFFTGRLLLLQLVVVAAVILAMELNYHFHFIPFIKGGLLHEEALRQMVTGTVIVLNCMMLFFYEKQIRLWKSKARSTVGDLIQNKEAITRYMIESSHQSRTDLNVVYGILQHDVLQKRNTDMVEIPFRHLRIMLNSCKAVIDQSNNYLEWSRIGEGLPSPINYHTLDLHAWFDDIADRFRMLAQNKPANLVSVIHKSVPSHIYTDKNRLETIVGNLLTNAIKFTRRHTTIRLNMMRVGPVLVISVTDQGMGIPENMHETIFQPFTTENNSFLQGSGIGLHVSRELARMMDGDLVVAESDSTGSTFSLYIPADIIEATPAIADPEETVQVREVSTLVIDDDRMCRHVAGIHLARHVRHVFEAETMEEAMRILSSEEIDLILLDINLSADYSGLDLLRLIRTTWKTSNIPVIVVSGDVITGDRRDAAIDAGATAFVTKPIIFRELFKLISRLPGKHEKIPRFF